MPDSATLPTVQDAVALGLTEAEYALICEKQGSSMDNVAYGNWTGGEPVYVRVKVEAVLLSQGTCRLQCLAYKVRDKGSFAFEEEVKVAGMGSHAYQKMLNEVAAKLKAPP